jgi:hypothetical protein
MSVDIAPMSVDIGLVSLAPHPMPATDRPLDPAPVHFHASVPAVDKTRKLPYIDRSRCMYMHRDLMGAGRLSDPRRFAHSPYQPEPSSLTL